MYKNTMFNSRQSQLTPWRNTGDLKMKKWEKRLAKLEEMQRFIEKEIGKIKYKQRKKEMDAQRGSLVL